MEVESVFVWFIGHLWQGLTAAVLFHFFGFFTKLGHWSTLWTGYKS